MASEIWHPADNLCVGQRIVINGQIPHMVTEIKSGMARLVEERSNRQMRRAFNRVARMARRRP